MRAREFIIEQANITQPTEPYKPQHFQTDENGVPIIPNDDGHMNTHSQDQDSNTYGSLRGVIPIEAQAAMPGAFSVEDLHSDFYGVYRLGMGIAAGNRNIATADNFGKHPFIMPFHPNEHAAIEKEVKRMGHKIKQRTSTPSVELSTTNVVSPVSNWNKQK